MTMHSQTAGAFGQLKSRKRSLGSQANWCGKLPGRAAHCGSIIFVDVPDAQYFLTSLSQQFAAKAVSGIVLRRSSFGLSQAAVGGRRNTPRTNGTARQTDTGAEPACGRENSFRTMRTPLRISRTVRPWPVFARISSNNLQITNQRL
jgi:hypothetical protein